MMRFGRVHLFILAAILVMAGSGAAVKVFASDVSPAVACLASENCFPKPVNTGPGATGIPPDTVLHACGGDVTLSTDDQTINGCTYTGNLTISGQNVTVRNTRIMGYVQTSGSGSLLIEDSEIGPDSGCPTSDDWVALIRWSNYTARRNYLHNNGDGFRAAGDDITIEDNFVKLCGNDGDHSDGVQGDHSGQDNVVNHNTIDQRLAADHATAPVFFADFSESATVTDNLLIATSADSFALRIHDDHDTDIGPWIITGNRLIGTTFSDNTDCEADTTTWANNREVTIDSDYNILTTGVTYNCDGSTVDTLIGDLNDDGSIDQDDLTLLKADYRQTTSSATTPEADLNGDGKINVKDLSLLLHNWTG